MNVNGDSRNILVETGTIASLKLDLVKKSFVPFHKPFPIDWLAFSIPENTTIRLKKSDLAVALKNRPVPTAPPNETTSAAMAPRNPPCRSPHNLVLLVLICDFKA